MFLRNIAKKEVKQHFRFLSGTFEDKEITHVEGEVDPIRDLDIINEELRLKVGWFGHL